jgi:flagella basal body P-ring formation protein FlgA
MRALLNAVAILMAASLSIGVALAAPVLKPQALVERDMVRLSDLFGELPASVNPAIEVTHAPAPGQRLTLDASTLLNIANSQHIGWQPSSRFDRVVVERAGQVISATAVHDAVVRALVEGGLPENTEITLDNERLQLVIATGQPPTVRAEVPQFDPTKPRFEATVFAPAEAADADRVTIKVTGKAFRMVDIPVLVRPVAAGEVIRARDIQMVRLHADQVGPTNINDPDKLADKSARRVLPAGQPIRVSDVSAPVLVSKNNLVNVTITTKRLSITMQGKAMEDGAEGDTVRIVNTRSNKIVQGVVSGKGEVVVSTGYSVVSN